MNLIAERIAPMKDAAVTAATTRMVNRIKHLLAEVREAGFCIKQFRLDSRNSKEAYAKLQIIRRITKRDEALAKRNGINPNHVDGWDYVQGCEDGIGNLVKEVADMAAAQYEEYVCKLTQKVGSYDEIKVQTVSGLWTESILTATKDGVDTKWKTQIIVNFSKYGLAFNQFPTRKIK
jgi:hypothetical protein